MIETPTNIDRLKESWDLIKDSNVQVRRENGMIMLTAELGLVKRHLELITSMLIELDDRIKKLEKS